VLLSTREDELRDEGRDGDRGQYVSRLKRDFKDALDEISSDELASHHGLCCKKRFVALHRDREFARGGEDGHGRETTDNGE
jgi:hypothetical protein